MTKLLAAATLASGASLAAAHDSHGMDLGHGHASDAWGGFVMLGVVAALAWWMRRGK